MGLFSKRKDELKEWKKIKEELNIIDHLNFDATNIFNPNIKTARAFVPANLIRVTNNNHFAPLAIMLQEYIKGSQDEKFVVLISNSDNKNIIDFQHHAAAMYQGGYFGLGFNPSRRTLTFYYINTGKMQGLNGGESLLGAAPSQESVIIIKEFNTSKIENIQHKYHFTGYYTLDFDYELTHFYTQYTSSNKVKTNFDYAIDNAPLIFKKLIDEIRISTDHKNHLRKNNPNTEFFQFSIKQSTLESYDDYEPFVQIPNIVTSIGDEAFDGHSKILELLMPDDIKSIGNSAFSGCSSLTSITIPNSVTSIGDRAFAECESIKNLTIPNNVTYVGERAFFEWYDDQIIYVNKEQSIKWNKNWKKDCEATIIYR